MYINHVIYQSDFKALLKKTSISDRAFHYFSDLYRRYGESFKIKKSKKTYKIEELYDALLSEVKLFLNLQEFDYLFFPHDRYFFNSDQAAIELYCKNKHALTSKLMDVRDCGALCVFYAISFFKNLLLSETINQMGLISAESDYCDFMGWCAISKELKTNHSLKILDIAIINREKTINHKEKLIVKNHIKKESLFIFSRDQFSFPVSSGFIYFSLNKIMNSAEFEKKHYFMIIDKDSFENTDAIILLKRVDDYV